MSDGGGPSTSAASGTRTTPPISSCHPVAAMRFGGAGKRLVSTTPMANDRLAPTAASTPTGSMSAPGRTTTRVTPSAATQPTTRSSRRGRCRETIHVNVATRTGWSPPSAPATPPGSR